jgi:hyperosmotically inducible periplasmic protein
MASTPIPAKEPVMMKPAIPVLFIAAIAAQGAGAQTPSTQPVNPPPAPTVVVPSNPALRPPSALPEVPPPTPPQSTVAVAVSDSTITSKVRDAIASDSDLKSMSVTVETTDSIVTLNGTADSREQIARALAVARTVEGVKGVTNVLAVKTS